MAVVLLSAAAMKAHEIGTSAQLETDVFSSRWFLIGVVEFELALGLWLLSGLWPRGTRWLAIGCFGIFAAVSIKHGIQGRASCGCFGRLSINPWLTSIFDLSAVAALVNSTRTPVSTRRGWRPRAAAVCCAFLGLAIPSAAIMAACRPASLAPDGGIAVGPGGAVIIEPTDWLGMPFPVLRHVDIGDALARGKWNLVFYRHDCPDCQKAIARLESWLDGESVEPGRIALVEVPPFGELPAALSDQVAKLTRARLEASHDWFVATPTATLLEDGRLVAARRLVN